MKSIFYLLVFTLFFTSAIKAQEATWETYTTNAYEIKYPSVLSTFKTFVTNL